ncbi:TetR/AcrR family transcriptional regulator [Acinetobacter sp. S40]|uniref:TetR/AcrR family transcriptional regulator n=1 Tax=Acinetobacter sp. S40 TaxID=2767434 RepID=UPI00190CBE76|nr:TetR/AcrR family transcriptional regulator [Acinetobacter sp. S40]MBJ9986905.1 TetR/AcrR family transcriptional regulator [Acinetobacter sp. S40]
MTKLDNTLMMDELTELPKKKRGRPKCFNEEQALQKAMLLFWEHGYEATSINDLTQALEITAPSLYSSFGDKTTLFYKSIDYYLAHEACPIESIFTQARTAKIAFELFLYDNIKRLMQPNKPKGCMLITAAMNGSEQTQDVQHNLLEKRLATKQKLCERLQQGVREGDLSNAAPIATMTDFYCTVIQGLTVQARDGANIDELNQVVEHAMKAWDLFET